MVKAKTAKDPPTIMNGPPYSLVVESSVMTPEEKQKTKKKKKRSSSRDGHNVARPESEEEFLSLDFSSRCAVAGLQLGRTKVFLRREAFDRIEAMRSETFFNAAATIQKIARGKQCREYFLIMRYAATVIQSLFRMRLSLRRVEGERALKSVVTIQSAWRMYDAKLSVAQIVYARIAAAKMIQRFYRHKQIMARQAEMQSSISEDDIIRAVTQVQAMYRGSKTRTAVLEMMQAQERQERERIAREERIRAEDERKAAAAAAAATAASTAAIVSSPKVERQVAPIDRGTTTALAVSGELETELYRQIQEENWAMVENLLDQHPELAETADPKSGELPLHMIARHTGAWTLLIDMVLVLYPKALIHRDKMGALPIHHAAAHDNLAALEIIYSAYKEGINDTDRKGRLPIHVAAEFDAVDTVKFLLAKSPEGAYTMVYRPPNNAGGGLPLHIACRNYASIGVITALLAENFASAKRADENGDLPLHLLLRCGEVVDQVVVKTLLTCFSSAASRTDMNGDLPLAIAIKHQCRSAVINTVLMQFSEGAGVLNGDGHSPLFLAFKHNADDRTIMGLLNHAPEVSLFVVPIIFSAWEYLLTLRLPRRLQLATAVDRKTGLLPIQVATENEHSHFIVHNLLKRDMPIDMKEKVRAQLLPHHYSWNHIVSNTDDLYHQVVTKVLQSCTQPQVLALAHVEGPDGKIALAAATPVCKHEMRVMLRLFNTLEVVNQRPAYTNPVSDTQIFYALRYEPPKDHSGQFTVLHEDRRDGGDNDYVEDWDDSSQVSAVSRNSIRSTLSSRSQQTIEDKLRYIRKEKGQQVIAKLTSRSDVVERELKVRKEHHLSRHYVPAIISVHHTVQHAAYSEAMAEPGYCITMEGADTTAENLMLDMRKSGKQFPAKALKRIGISLLHMHEHGLIHCDFGTHNIGKFGSRWKLLGVGGSVPIGEPTDPNRGFYHPPESIVVENKRVPIGKKSVSACVVAIPAKTTYDIWAYGVVVYEAIAKMPLSPYACRGKRAMSATEVGKIGLWDELSIRKALKHIPEDEVVRDLIKRLLHYDPEQRFRSMRDVLEHPFFTGGNLDDQHGGPRTNGTVKSSGSSSPRQSSSQSRQRQSENTSGNSTSSRTTSRAASVEMSTKEPVVAAVASDETSGSDQENRLNGVFKAPAGKPSSKSSEPGVSNVGSSSPSNNTLSSNRSSKSFKGALRNRFARARRSKQHS